jgi:heme exporter protein B
MKKALAIAAKDLRAETRSKEIAPAMLLFSLSLVFLFTFALPPGAGQAAVPPPIAGGVGALEIASVFLWSSLLFAGIVGFARSAALEKEGSRIDGLVLSPVDPAWLFLGKAFALFIYLSITQVVVLIFLFLFIDLPPQAIAATTAIAMLVNIGLAAVGTLFATATQYTRAKELVLPLLIFPTVLPLLLAAIRLTTAVFERLDPFAETRWFILIAIYDIIFTTIGAVTYEFVIRD